MLIVILGLIFIQIHTSFAQCCAPGGVWSEWTIDASGCYDYCGGAGMMTKTRTCLSEGDNCPCVGLATEILACETYPCIFPRNNSCSPGKTVRTFDKRIQCVTPEEVPPIDIVLPNSICLGCCPTGGVWSEWKDFGVCSDSCGACGQVNRTRTCLSTRFGCACTAATWMLQPCNRKPCVGRATECCAGTTKTVVQGTPTCTEEVAQPVIMQEPGCCFDKYGIWNNWSNWATCSATCGMCGTKRRTRTCATEPHGCVCAGAAEEVTQCGEIACTGATPCCAPAIKYKAYDGADICMMNQPPVIGPGVWSPYVTVTGKSCNDTCGGFGRVAQYRKCLPVGSTCQGDHFAINPCGFDVCTVPRPSCAPGYKKIIDTVRNTFICSE